MALNPTVLILPFLFAAMAPVAWSQSPTYPPIDRYLMVRDSEVALAHSAAPAAIADRATIKVLTRSGFEVARQGDNGAVCLVMRGFSAPTYTPAQFRDLVYDPTLRSPICFTAPAVRTVLPFYELRTRLAMEGKTPDQIARALEAAYARGELPRRDGVTFAYMFSAHSHLAPGIGAWLPHMMVFSPYYDSAMLGGNADGSPLPQVSSDGGTPFTVVVIPVDERLAVRIPQIPQHRRDKH
jgi:hypothetical protein